MIFKRSIVLMAFMSCLLFADHMFHEVAAQMGISGQTGLGHAVGWCDIDGDGDCDLAFSNQNDGGFWLYRNDDSIFTDITSSAGLSGLTAYRVLWGDVTGDDRPDLIVRTWGSGQRIYRNDGNCHFTDITGSSGIGGSGYALADFDNDGSIDVLSFTSSSCGIYYNSGSGTFSYSQVSGSNDFQTATCFDYDLDGWVDIYAGTYGSNPNKLYRNLGDGSFEDVTAAANVEWAGGTSGVASGDYNNDGYPDLYLGNTSAPGCKMFQNQENGTFVDVTSTAGLIGHDDTRTVNFLDYNNDGFLDIFVSNHDFYVYSSQLYRNNQNGTFTDVGAEMGLSGQWMGDYFGTGWADFNRDGAIDLFAAGHIDKYVLFRNDSCPGNHLTVHLIGTMSNYHGIGAVVKAWINTQCLTRFVVAGEGKHDFHSYDVEFGLDANSSVDSLHVRWPSGYISRLDSVITANQFITIVEGETGADEQAHGNHPLRDARLKNYPNPFVVHTVVPGHERACFDVYDAAGTRVGSYPGGRIGADLCPGVYFVRMESMNQMIRIVKIR